MALEYSVFGGAAAPAASPFACAFFRSSDECVPALRPSVLALVALLHRDESQSTAFSAGDWAIAVEWLERTGLTLIAQPSLPAAARCAS